ncbi:MAG: GNAT family N-acetyltransferase [Planctomycetes bacterium]|nr:GNAT family N-acetyltransferase [Planctomycetota bacterium]
MPDHLTNGRIRLRRYRPDDIDPQFEAAIESVAEVHPWLPWCHPEYTREESAAWVQSRQAAWERDEEYSFVIADCQTDRFVGGCGLNQIDRLRLRANLGYWVRTSETGRGVATAATRLLARFGFEELGLQRIEIVAAVDNHGSQRVAMKAGATRECVARNRLRMHDRQFDAVCFSLIPSDLRFTAPANTMHGETGSSPPRKLG